MSNPTISPSIPLSAQSTTSAPPKFTTATANPQPQPLLYAHPETLRCATHPHASKKRKKDSKPPLPPPGCVACTYKLLKPDVSLDTAFTAIFPNVRPEMCPRCSNPTTTKNTPPSPMDKALGDSVLTVGDGDLTFSFALRQSLSASTKIHASSYETLATLLKVYGSTIPSVISTVGDSNVSYSVDATKLRETLTKASPKTEGEMYSSIIWNFPCTAEASGQDGQNTEMEQNKELLRGFVKCASAMLKDKGVVVLTHKTKPPYNHWKIVDVVEGVEVRRSEERSFELGMWYMYK
ncbi:hypothetical protein TL16_g10695 [Triparma laevis f. inornata]|uniref:25S rRNA (uridine-N(3))-methyltransferase BMT5-like domain-containing protein n=2 Tax=Triparma laevis TaxID=1534972 RepID=A0A9W7F1E6_9STRA|nr:hypothetical protein TL16_g10695 [Triparma laevis f. inornata]GMH99558.1 hypothetical protein TrLO_g13881 [Triparma laevis f. longispina]